MIKILILVAFGLSALADTPPPGTVKSRTYSGDGVTAITSTGTSLNVNVTNSSGTSTVNQGNAGVQSWLAAITSLPALATGENTIGNVNINGTVPVSGSFTFTDPTAGSLGIAAPLQATQVGGVDGSGNLRALKTSNTGVLSVDASGVTVPVSGTFWQATQPISGSVTANAGTNLNTSTLAVESGGHLASIDTKLPSQGQALAANSVPVVLTAAQISILTPLSSVTVSGTVTANAGSGTLSVDASGSTVPVSGTFWQTTQPISAATLPLPSGAATSVKQPTLGMAGTPSTDVLTVQGIASMTALKVDGSSTTQPVSGTFWQTTQPVSGTLVVVSSAGSTPSQATSTVSTVITLTAPANAQGFILQNLGTSTANVRFAMGATATTTVGMQLAPGQDSGFVPANSDVSLVAESGTQNYNIQWVAR